MRKIIALLLAVATCFAAVACRNTDGNTAETETTATETVKVTVDLPETSKNEETEKIQSDGEKDDPTPNVTPLLYKVTDAKGNVAWLFGSIHVGRENFYPLPEYVMNAFNGSDSLAVEFDIVAFQEDIGAMTDMIYMMMYDDGSTVDEHISAETYEAAVAVLEESGMYIQYYDYFIAGFWADLIDSLVFEEMGVYDGEPGIDEHLINKAYDTDKPVLDVESAEFQYGMTANYSDELQEMLLQQSIAMYETDYDEIWAELNIMLDAWAEGDAEKLRELLAEEGEGYSDEEKLLYEEYNNAMTVSRNVNMADYAEEALASGEEVFICVGAAHVVGEGGMVELLTERGYTVEEVN